MTSHGHELQRPRRGTFRILAIDGGGARGLIPATVLAHLQRLLFERDPQADLAASFDLIVGTSTGGLIALGLTIPGSDGREAIGAAQIPDLFRGPELARVFSRHRALELPLVSTLAELVEPKYRGTALRDLLRSRFGDARLADARQATMVSAYDMYARRPRFYKSWHADTGQVEAVEAGLATAAAPTYFPPVDDRREGAIVDGGVFVNNPALAGLVEALKRVETGPLRLDDTFVVSLGTGRWEPGFRQQHVARWGRLGWILPKKGEPPVVGAMLDGQSDAVHHWAHFLLNHVPGEVAARGPGIGRGPRYVRFQVDLPGGLPLDGVKPGQIRELERCAERLIDEQADQLEAVAEALAGD